MAMMAWKRMLLSNRTILSAQSPHLIPGLSRFFSKSPQYVVKVGIPEFLNGVGKGVETHVAKLETEIGDFQKLLVTRTLKLKKLGIPCKHRKLILKYTHKYRLGLWRPRAEPVKA
ncbi:IGR protein motif [Macleaya cordata]|uniref:IGR protein motif n=1 Tax=Macleaya cordata TaxID=56857 RepID=A0A200QSY7_MACCD|nr:IGR protein motif [Macleaya cordata]